MIWQPEQQLAIIKQVTSLCIALFDHNIYWDQGDLGSNNVLFPVTQDKVVLIDFGSWGKYVPHWKRESLAKILAIGCYHILSLISIRPPFPEERMTTREQLVDWLQNVKV